MIYDCFTFFNEYDLLEIRLHELRDVVDRFVICESDLTHTGKEKPLNFPKVRDKYRDFDIEYLVYRGIADVGDAWINEENQRNYLINGLSNCKSEDIVILSDMDELPDPQAIRQFDQPCICTLEMNLSYYFMNCLFPNKWLHAKIFQYGNTIAGTLSDIRLSRGGWLTKTIPNGGTHFSYLGGVDQIRYKLSAFAHQEYNNADYADPAVIRRRMESSEDLYGRGEALVTYPLGEGGYYFPKYVLENPERFSHLIRPKSRRKPVRISPFAPSCGPAPLRPRS